MSQQYKHYMHNNVYEFPTGNVALEDFQRSTKMPVGILWMYWGYYCTKQLSVICLKIQN